MAFAQASAGFLERIQPKVEAAARQDSRLFNRCEVVRTGAGELPSEAELQIMTFVRVYRAIAADFSAYTRELVRIGSDDETLREAAALANRAASRWSVLKRTRPDICLVLRRWQAAGGKRGFDTRPVMGVPKTLLDKRGVDRSRLADENHMALEAAGRRLEALGVSPAEARAFVVSGDFFSSEALGIP